MVQRASVFGNAVTIAQLEYGRMPANLSQAGLIDRPAHVQRHIIQIRIGARHAVNKLLYGRHRVVAHGYDVINQVIVNHAFLALMVLIEHVTKKPEQHVALASAHAEARPTVRADVCPVVRTILLYRKKRQIPRIQLVGKIDCRVEPDASIIGQQAATQYVAEVGQGYFPALHLVGNMLRNGYIVALIGVCYHIYGVASAVLAD